MEDIYLDDFNDHQLYDTDIREDIDSLINDDNIQAACVLWGRVSDTEY